MEYVYDLMKYKNDRPCVVTIGKFDGLHRGHQLLINKIEELAYELDLSSVVCAMDFSSYWEEKKIMPELLMTKEERREKLESRVDYLVEAVFNKAFMKLSGEDFIEKVISEKLHARYVVVGEDFHFGYKKSGNIELLERLEDKYGYETIVIKKKCYEGKVISSSRIKELIKAGDVEKANELLGYHFAYEGEVIHGNAIGRTLGIPTVNILPQAFKILPIKGVYYAKVIVANRSYQAVTNVGDKPTIDDKHNLVIESYLLDFNQDIYGKNVKVELHKFRRREEKFSSLEEMKVAMQEDVEGTKEYF
ncbi:MAG TPA: bifunctional riboflavin kinase/FAD synthetase [Candidatus Dorea intestinavium]|nr:bifunctional riboflavin kinase/FAD synthetase [Candidatus Dorea intestinavium]